MSANKGRIKGEQKREWERGSKNLLDAHYICFQHNDAAGQSVSQFVRPFYQTQNTHRDSSSSPLPANTSLPRAPPLARLSIIASPSLYYLSVLPLTPFPSLVLLSVLALLLKSSFALCIRVSFACVSSLSSPHIP